MARKAVQGLNLFSVAFQLYRNGYVPISTFLIRLTDFQTINVLNYANL